MVAANDGSYECEAEKLRTQNIILWNDFLSFYSQFDEVIILGGTYAISEGKMQNVSLVVKLSLLLQPNSLLPMHHLWFGIDTYIF
jgi:hypothetical protein